MTGLDSFALTTVAIIWAMGGFVWAKKSMKMAALCAAVAVAFAAAVLWP